MLDFFGKSKKTKTTDNDGGESQEASSFSSSTDCPADKSASVQNPNESETSAASDQPSTSGQKKTEKRSFQKNWLRDKKIGYNINVLQQTACLVVNPITVGNFAFLFNCTPVGRTSDSMMVPT